jgi:YD repeat-containing protein
MCVASEPNFSISIYRESSLFGYTGSRLQSITDPFGGGITTLTYGGGSSQIQSIEDAAYRFTTFTLSGGELTAVEYPDDSTWNYGYTSGQMTSVTEPSSTGEPTKIVTVTYDSAGRVGTITQANGTTEAFSPGQVQGWTNSGTTGSPAAAVLLSEVGSSFTDPLGDVTSDSPDWRGMGLTDQDAMNRETGTTDAAGSAIAGISTFTFDKAGNPVTSTDPDHDTTTTTFDALDRVSTVETPDGGLTTYQYDNACRLQVLIDPALNRNTYAYDSMGWRTTLTSPSVNSSTGVVSTTEYDADGEVVEATDADGREVTYSYDKNGGQITAAYRRPAAIPFP